MKKLVDMIKQDPAFADVHPRVSMASIFFGRGQAERRVYVAWYEDGGISSPWPSGPPWPARIYRARSPAGRGAPRSCVEPESAVAITPRARRDNGRQMATRAEELSGSRLTIAWSTTTTAESSAAHKHPRTDVPMDRCANRPARAIVHGADEGSPVSRFAPSWIGPARAAASAAASAAPRIPSV